MCLVYVQELKEPSSSILPDSLDTLDGDINGSGFKRLTRVVLLVTYFSVPTPPLYQPLLYIAKNV